MVNNSPEEYGRSMRKYASLLVFGAIVAAVAATQLSTAATAPPLPSADKFAGEVTNPWFPLKPGTVFTSRGSEDGDKTRDVFTVTNRKKTILGIKATVIDDRVYVNGRLEERTNDWYAQDKDGNVWYLGEATATLDSKGRVHSREGSWRAGVNGAKAGIFMPAHPKVGYTARQEFYKGHAEDEFKILSLTSHVKTPAVSSSHAMVTQETTPLEKGVVDHKIYVRGYGTVAEDTVKGGSEKAQLVSVRRP
jgi:hypothetical protein